MPASRIAAFALLVSMPVLVGAVPAPVLQRWEHGGAQIELSRVRMLAQRLGKQNALYQLNLAETRKRDAVATAEAIDAALVSLQQGQPARAIPIPPTPAVRSAIEELDASWGPLRRLALASPFDYKRGVAPTGADPLLLGRFDDLVSAFDGRAAEAVDEYVVVCRQVGIPNCEAVAYATTAGLLSERLVKEAALVVAGLAVDQNSARLRKSVDELARAMAFAAAQEPVQSAMSPERGAIGVRVGNLWSDIEGHFERLQRDVEAILAGRAERADFEETVAAQQRFLTDIQRLSLAVRRFAAQRRAVGAGPPP